MRRFVSNLAHDKVAAAGVALLVLILVTEPGMGLLILLGLAMAGVGVRIEERPPHWLLRTPLRRWLHASSAKDRR